MAVKTVGRKGTLGRKDSFKDVGSVADFVAVLNNKLSDFADDAAEWIVGHPKTVKVIAGALAVIAGAATSGIASIALGAGLAALEESVVGLAAKRVEEIKKREGGDKKNDEKDGKADEKTKQKEAELTPEKMHEKLQVIEDVLMKSMNEAGNSVSQEERNQIQQNLTALKESLSNSPHKPKATHFVDGKQVELHNHDHFVDKIKSHDGNDGAARAA